MRAARGRYRYFFIVWNALVVCQCLENHHSSVVLMAPEESGLGMMEGLSSCSFSRMKQFIQGATQPGMELSLYESLQFVFHYSLIYIMMFINTYSEQVISTTNNLPGFLQVAYIKPSTACRYASYQTVNLCYLLQKQYIFCKLQSKMIFFRLLYNRCISFVLCFYLKATVIQ